VANQNKVSGLTPVKYLNGADWTGQANMYHINSADTNAYYVGDPVSLVAGVEGVAGESYGLQTIQVGQVGAANVGVVVGVSSNPRGLGPIINPADLTKTWRPAAAQTTGWFALVVDDPQVVFEIQEQGTGTVLTVAATSKNANFALAAPAAGSNVSGAYLNNATAPATTNTYNLKLLGLSQKYDPSNALYNTFGLYAKWLCLLNNHYYGQYGGRTGI
jgi:hypothetical protein